MSTDGLRLRFLPDDVWLGKLTASVSIGGYRGVGEAWFARAHLAAFAQAITAFPLSDPLPILSGGLGGYENNPEHALVTIAFETHNAVGAIRAMVRLGTDDNGPNLHHEVTTRFLVSYSALARFGPELRDVIDGRYEEAVLAAEP